MLTEIKRAIQSFIGKQLIHLVKRLAKEPTRAFKNKNIIIDVYSSTDQ